MPSLVPRRIRLVLLVIAILLGIAWALVLERRRLDIITLDAPDGLPVLTEAGDFALPDPDGRLRRRDDLLGKIWTANVFFTTCPTICPALMGNLGAVQTAFRDDPRVVTVSLTIDPANDTPEALAAYAEARGMDRERWWLLRGSPEEMQRVATQGWRLGSLEDPIHHSAFVVLIDAAGQIRGFYNGMEASGLERLLADIRRLLAETPAETLAGARR